MARRELCARTTKGRSSPGSDAQRIGASRSRPRRTGEDEQIGGADLEQKSAPESLARVPTSGRGDGADQARPHRRPPGEPGPQAVARDHRQHGEGDDQGQEDEDDRAPEAVGGELQAALGDVAEIAEAAGVEDRAGEVGVGAGDEVDQGQQRQDREREGDDQERRAAAARRDRRGSRGGPDREDDRRADVGAEAPRGEDEGRADSRSRGRRRRSAAGDSRAARTRSAPPRCRRRPGPPAAPRARCRSRRSALPGRGWARAARARSAASRR